MAESTNHLERLKRAGRNRIGISRERLFGISLVSPPLLIFFLITVIPLCIGIGLSFYGGLGVLTYNFVGIENYQALVGDGTFWQSLLTGIIFAVYSVFIQMVLGVAIALVINEQFKFANIVRTIVLVPYLIPTVAVAIIWQWLLNNNYGVVNYVLSETLGTTVNFFDVPTAIHSISWVASWKFTIFVVLLVLARLQSIDSSLYEMAEVNGANFYQRFIDVTLPNLRTTLAIVLLLRSIWMFNKFDIIYLMTQGGPFDATLTQTVLAYNRAFVDLQFGSGAAITTVMFVAILFASIVYFRVFRPEEEVATHD
ncbi:MAG: carbohydrate ABC transporter permease [Haloplanus sp.]